MKENLGKAEAIVRAFGKTVELLSLDIMTKYPAMSFLQSHLPFPKKEIEEALNIAIKYSNDEKMTESLKTCAYMLTLFIDDEEARKKNEPLLKRIRERENNK